MVLNRTVICSFIIILFHLVGLYGFLTPELSKLFIDLVPFHLLLMLLLLIFSIKERSSHILLFAGIIFTAGFLIELIGVNTDAIFGSYTYGKALGIKLWQTPLLIGINWLILVYCTGIFLEQFKIKNRFIFSLLGALILLSLDILIEPVAMRFDYWTWDGSVIPVQNYLAWFLFSGLMLWIFSSMSFNKQNKAAVVLLFSQFIFFAVLNKWY